MTRSLQDLCILVRPRVYELIARLAEQGVAVCVVDVLRTDAEQADLLERGLSDTLKSKHLAQRGCAKSHAVDLAPYETYQLHGQDKIQWNAADPAWAVMGETGEALGFRWGGRWRQPHDPGHFELAIDHTGAQAPEGGGEQR